jgi:hypothetical protein
MGFATQNKLQPCFQQPREETFPKRSHYFRVKPKPSWSLSTTRPNPCWLVDDDKAVEKTRYALGRGTSRTAAASREDLGETELRGEEEFERPEKRVRCDSNEEAEPRIDETPSLMHFATSPHATRGIATVGATRVEASTIPPVSAVQQPGTYSRHITSLSLKLQSMAKEMEICAHLVKV